MFLLGVILTTLAILGALTALALKEGYRLVHPTATTAALLSLLLLGILLLAADTQVVR